MADEPQPPEAAAAPAPAPPPSPAPAVYELILAKLIAKQAGNPACPICHTTFFTIGYYTAPEIWTKRDHGRSGGRSYPLVAMSCNNCGYTQFINLLILGFTESELAELTWPDFAPLPEPPKQSTSDGSGQG